MARKRKVEEEIDDSAALDATADALGVDMTPPEFTDDEKAEELPPTKDLKAKGVVQSEEAEEPAEETTEEPAEETTEESAEETTAEPVNWEQRFKDLEQSSRAKEQEFSQAREGLMREVVQLRRRGGGTPPPVPEGTPTTIGGIPIAFDEKGNGFVSPDSLMQVLLPMLRVDSVRTMRDFLEEQVVSSFEDGAGARAARDELRLAYDALNGLVVEEQKLLNYGQLSSVDEAVQFIEGSSVGRRWRERFPKVAPGATELGRFLRANLLNDASAIRAVLTDYAKQRAVTTTPAVEVSEAARTLAKARGVPKPPPPPVRPVPEERPRPQALRGRAAKGEVTSSAEEELAQLEEKNILEWTDEDRKRFQVLVRQVEGARASG